jgi:hypothetical protein
MPNDERSLLPVLKAELAFLEKGGYRNTPDAQWRPKFLFEDSPTCLNFHRVKDRRPCSDCVMNTLVPSDCLAETYPCRHIPLNEAGFTIDTYYRLGTFEEAEVALRTWLQKMIQKLETLAPDENSPKR